MRFIHYDGTAVRGDLTYESAVAAFHSSEAASATTCPSQGLLWVDLPSPSAGQLEGVIADFALHPSLGGDWSSVRHRPKAREFDNYLLVVLNCIDDSLQDARSLFVVVGRNLLLTIHKEAIGPLDALMKKCAGDASPMARGADYLLLMLADDIVDRFFPALDKIDGRVGYIESRVLNEGRERILNHLFLLKRQCLYLRKLLGPLRDVFSTLARMDSKFVRPVLRPQFLGIYDHTLRLFETVDTYRDLLSSALEVYLSAQSNRMNEIMKTLTIIATIMMPLTVITGIYGMNFPGIPEFKWKLGYQAVLAVMSAITVGMLVWFRKRRWL